jgi:hypothetical protein
MLGRFIVPVARLGEFEAAAEALLPRGSEGSPWPLSALVGKDWEVDRERLRIFNESHSVAAAGLVTVEAIEIPLSAGEQARVLCELFSSFEIYCEVDSASDPSPLLAAIAPFANQGARAKIRTGGVIPEAIPSPARVARFLVAAAREGVALKATAGLHHPLRGEYPLTYEPDSPRGTMHGFLNLFLAAAFLASDGLDEGQAVELLGERSANAFTFSDGEVRWGEHRLTAAALSRARASFATSYGSCSFSEPMDDLRRLGLLA